jgi:predicted Zn-dependent peptidase
MKIFSLHYPAAVVALAAVSFTAFAAEIPSRPEKLAFPPLTYEPPNAADYRVQLPSGAVAYLVPDHELPLVNLSILVRTGTYVEPAGKEGLAGLTGYLLSRGGAGSKTAEQLEERLDFLAASLGSGVGDTSGNMNLNLMAKDLDEGLALLRDVLTAPRFQDDKLALRKQQMLQEMKQRNDDSSSIEGRERSYLAYGEDFFLNHQPTQASVEAITRADLEAFQQKWFNPANFVLAVSGDFDRANMIERLNKLFANWPHPGEKAPPVPTQATLAKPGVYLVDKDVNQGRVGIMLPGVLRDNPDFLAISVMNDILGGGGFTSRIVNRVRSDEGLAYSAGSAFPGGVYYTPPFTAAFQTKSATVPYASAIVIEEMKRIASTPVEDKEIETTKNGMIDRFPRQFATKGQIAGVFANDEFSGRYAKNPDYWKTYRSRVAALTKADVQRVAQKYLAPDNVVILVVGKEADILKGSADHPVTLKSLGGDRYTKLPLRDPMTLKPLVN